MTTPFRGCTFISNICFQTALAGVKKCIRMLPLRRGGSWCWLGRGRPSEGSWQNMSACLLGLSLPQLRNLFFHHLLQLRCNAHSISTIMTDEEGVSGSDGEGVVQTTSEAQLGSAVYPTASIMNHSCCPNVIFRLAAVHHTGGLVPSLLGVEIKLAIPQRDWCACIFALYFTAAGIIVYCILPRFSGNRVVVCATKQILAGEEINNCYGESGGGYMTRFRDTLALLHNFRVNACRSPGGSNEEDREAGWTEEEILLWLLLSCLWRVSITVLFLSHSAILHLYLKHGEYLYIYSYFRTCRLQLCNNCNMESPQFFICPTELLLSCSTGKLWWMHLLVLSVKVPCKSWVKAITSAWTASTFASYWKKREWYCRVQFICKTCRYLICLVSCAAERSKEYVWDSMHTWQHMWVHVRVRCIRTEATWTL